jgi:hypothetical protein
MLSTDWHLFVCKLCWINDEIPEYVKEISNKVKRIVDVFDIIIFNLLIINISI